MRAIGIAGRAALALALALVPPASAAGAQEAPAPRPEEPEVQLIVLPVLGYAPETRFYFGAAVWRLRRAREPLGRPTLFTADAIYTQNRQLAVTTGLDRWSAGNTWHLVAGAAITRFPFTFYGIGATASDSSERYTPRTITASLAVQRRLKPGWYGGASLFLRDFAMLETDTAGRLAPGTVPGSRGHFLTLLGVDVTRDTRAGVFGARAGAYVRIAGGLATGAFGSDFDYRRLNLDARAYRSLGATQVLAVQAVSDVVDGTAPFDLLPRLGGEAILRGYEQPRYRDDAMAATQVELRSHVFWRFGLAVFGGVGAVAPAPGDLADAEWRAAGGAGVRFAISRTEGLNVRFDLAWGKNGSAFYIGAGEAF